MVDVTKSTKPVTGERMYKSADDKNVAANIVYLNGSNIAYYDAEFKNIVPNEKMFDLFIQGVVAFKSGMYYKAVSCTKDGAISFGL